MQHPFPVPLTSFRGCSPIGEHSLHIMTIEIPPTPSLAAAARLAIVTVLKDAKALGPTLLLVYWQGT